MYWIVWKFKKYNNNGANHTFDKHEWEQQVIDNTIEFIEKELK